MSTDACHVLNNNSFYPVVKLNLAKMLAQCVCVVTALLLCCMCNGQPGTAGPVITETSLDMNLGIIEITFNTSVDITSFDPTVVTLVNSSDVDCSTANGYTLTGGITLTTMDFNTTVRHLLSVEDRFAILATENLASSQATSYICFTPTVLTDSGGRPAETLNLPFQFTEYVPDTTRPEIIEFLSVDLSLRQLAIEFSEPIDIATAIASEFTLQNHATAPVVSFTLTGGEFSYQQQEITQKRVVIVQLSADDYRFIVLEPAIATSTDNTFLSVSEGALSDFAGNPVMAVVGINASSFVPDTTTPTLLSFDLDVNEGLLILEFDNVMNPEPLQPRAITIQDNPTANAAYTLTGGTTESPPGYVIALKLSAFDVDRINRLTSIATSISNTYLSIRTNLITSYAGMQSVQAITGIRVRNLVTDSTPPMLIAFDLDLNQGELVLNFNENVDASTLDLTEIVLQNAPDNPTASFRLTDRMSSMSTLSDSATIAIFLDSSDLNDIKNLTNLAVDFFTTFLSHSNLTVNDTNGIAVVPIPPDDAVPVAGFVADTSPPSLMAFSLNANMGYLTFTFDETVNVSSLLTTAITLHGDNPEDSVTLTNSSFSGSANDDVITINIANENMNVQQFITNNVVSLSITSAAILDMNSNPVVPISSDDPLQQIFDPIDLTPPQLLSFSVDLDEGLLTLDFSEPINMSLILLERFTLQSGRSDDSFGYSPNNSFASASEDSSVLLISLSQTDLNEIKKIETLLVSRETSFLSFEFGAVQDIAGNDIPTVLRSEAREASSFTRDATNPSLLSFDIDMNTGLLILHFSETVNYMSLTFSGITLQNDSSGSDPIHSHTLTGGNVTPADDVNITVELNMSDLNQLKSLRIGIASTSVWLVVERDTIEDQSGNSFQGLPAIPVSFYTADITPPELEEFVLDFDYGGLLLTFSETVDALTFEPTTIAFQTTEVFSNALTDTYTLSGRSANVAVDGPSQEIILDRADLDAIFLLVTDVSNTYITIQSEGIDDVFGNPVVQINSTMALRASEVIEDVTSPVIVEFALDLTSEILVLMFSETVNASLLYVPAFQLLSSLATDPSTSSYRLTSDSQILGGDPSGQDSTVIAIQLGSNDLNSIKALTMLAVSAETTYLSANSNGISDLSGNALIEILSANPLQASSYTEDMSSPILEMFDLDMNIGLLTLIFDETVNASSLEPQEITLLGEASNETIYRRTLIGARNASIANSNVIAIYLLDSDLNDIKRQRGLATNVSTTYVTITENLVQDTNMNLATSISDGSAVQVTTFISDTTNPILLAFSLNLTSEILVLTFSETVEINSLDVSQITLLNHPQPTQSWTLVSDQFGNLATDDALVLRVMLDSTDLDQIKNLTDLATTLGNTYIAVTQELIQDANGNFNDPVSQSTPLNVSDFIPDLIRAELRYFNLDMDGCGLLTLAFSEIVNTSSLNVMQIELLDTVDVMASNVSYRLTSSYSSTPNSNVVEIQLHVDDLNEIKRLPQLATSANSTYMAFQLLITDLSGNDVVSISPFVSMQVLNYTSDTTPPVLQSFAIDLDEGCLLLSFSETVNSSSLQRDSFTIQNSSTLTESSLSLNQITLELPTDFIITVQLTENELNELKSITALATSRTDTWISVASAGVMDTFGNPLSSISSTNALQVSEYTGDITRPTLTSFNFDVDAGTLELQFDETVQASSLDYTQLTLQDTPHNGSMNTYTLSGGSHSTVETAIIVVTLSSFDLNEIKKIRDLASIDPTTSGSANNTNLDGNTYLSISSAAINDTSFNPVVEIPPSNAIRVTNITLDTTSPELLSFTFNLDSEQMILTFSETVDISTLMLDQFTVLGEPRSENYTLTGGSTPSENDVVVIVQLGVRDVNNIKRNLNIAVDDSSTLLYLETSAIRDMNANQLDFSQALQVQTFFADTRSPFLVSFELDLNTNVLILTFNETIRIQTLKITSVTIQDSSTLNFSDTTTYRNLQDADTLTSDDTVLPIQLQPLDVNYIKTFTNLATSVSNTFISLTNMTITDMNENPLSPVPSDSALQVSNFTADTTGPIMQTFYLNLTAETITCVFDETVNVDSFNPTMLVIVDSANDTNNTYMLTGGNILSLGNSILITLGITLEDLDAIKLDEELATSINTTYLQFDSMLVLDMNGNNIQPRFGNFTLQASLFTRDKVEPVLQSFRLNGDTGQLHLTFSEPVRVSTLYLLGVVVQNTNDSASINYRLTNGPSNSSNGREIEVIISSNDINNIRQLPDLATAVNNTFLAIDSTVIEDMSGNNVTAIPTSAALQAIDSIPDSTRPTLLAFDIDIDAGTLTLEFDETVRASSLNPTEITLQDTPRNDSMNAYSLTGGSADNTELTVIVVTLSFSDLNEIKKIRELASIPPTTAPVNNMTLPPDGNTFLSITSDAIEDTNFNPIVEIPPNNARRVRSITLDTTPPVLVSFDFNLNNEQMVLTFSEAVNVQTLNLTEITLIGSTPLENYTLTGGRVPPEDSYIIVVQLDISDVNNIKRNINIAVDDATTHLYLGPSSILDMNDNPLNVTEPLQVGEFSEDTRSPVLVSFDLDLNSDLLILTFNETMQVQTLNITEITIQDDNTLDFNDSSSHRRLVSGETLTSNDPVLMVRLTANDVNYIKMFPNLATSDINTFISFSSATIQDMNCNSVVPILPENSSRVAQFTEDITPPIMLSFELDLTTENISLEFDETVNVNSFDPTQLVIADSVFISKNTYMLTGGSILLFRNSTLITLGITPDNLDAIKVDDGLATSINTTYLQFDSMLVLDMNGNYITPRFGNFTLQASLFTRDEVEPLLQSFRLNGDTGQLHLTFSEPVRVSTLYLPGVVVQNTNDSASISYSLTDGSSNSSNGREIEVIISSNDINNIRQTPDLATNVNNTFLVIDSTVIEDMSGNNVTAIPTTAALQATDSIPDTTRPTLLAFDIDLDAGTLTLEFDETVRASSLNLTEITLQDTPHNDSMNVYSLTGGSADNTELIVIVVTLSFSDLNEIKKIRELASIPPTTAPVNNMTLPPDGNTFLSITSGAIEDTNFNPIVEIPPNNARRVRSITLDTTPPVLVSFDFNLNNEQMVLTFSETVNVQTLNLTEITLIGSTPLENYTLTGGRVPPEDNYIIVVQLDVSDVNNVKRNINIAVDDATTHLYLGPSSILDMNDNPLNVTEPLQVREFSEDTRSPVLVSFDLDLNSDLLILTFNETMQVLTLNITEITIQDDNTLDFNDSSSHRSLVSGETLTPDDPVLLIRLTPNDVNYIKVFPNLATSDINTFISFSSATIQDMNCNPVTPILSENASRVAQFTEDITSPFLISYELDLNAGHISFEFDETVNVNSFNASAIQLTGSLQDTMNGYNLTGGIISPATNSTFVTLILTTDDLNSIKINEALATSTNNTIININAVLVADTNGNFFQAVNDMVASGFTPDDVPPNLVSFDLDIDAGSLYLTFNEPVRVTTLNPASFTLQSTPVRSINVSSSYALTEGLSVSPNGINITLSISPFDLNSIKAISNLATGADNSYLVIENTAIEDMSGNNVTAINPSVAIQATRYIDDTGRPVLLRFDLDMNVGLLMLYFNEAVNFTSLHISTITLQSSSNVTGFNDSYSLTGGTINQLDTTTFTLQLSVEDLNQLKTLNIGVNNESSWLAIDNESGITDNSGNSILPRVNGISTISVSLYIPDSTPPDLTEFTFDRNSGVLCLTFSETVDASTFDPTVVTFQSNASNPDILFTLSAGSLNSAFNLPLQKVFLSMEDQNELKELLFLATNVNNTYLIVQAGAVQDVFGNAIIIATVQATRVDPDTTSPMLQSYSLDLTNETLTLTFSEVVHFSLSNIPSFELLSANSADNTTAVYRLTTASRIHGGNLTDLGSVITIQLRSGDLNHIKALPMLAVSTNTTYMAVSNSSVVDTSGNTLLDIPRSDALEVSDFTEDTKSPILDRFYLDMNIGLLTLVFDETVDVVTLRPEEITLLGSSNTSLSRYSLTGASNVTATDFNVVEMTVLDSDLNEIKFQRGLADNISSTYLSITTDLILDTNMNSIETISDSNALQVALFTNDSTNPILREFNLNLSSDILTLIFSETVRPETLDVTKITLLNGPQAIESQFWELEAVNSNDNAVLSDNIVLSIQLDVRDLNEVKNLTDLATSMDNTYISVDEGLILDTNMNSNNPSGTIQVSDFVEDLVRPEIDSFTLDLDGNGLLILQFSETVNATTLDVTQITLLRQRSDTGFHHSLSLLSDSSSPNHPTIVIQLDRSDLNQIKTFPHLANSSLPIYLSASEQIIKDMNGNPNAEIRSLDAIPVNTYILDTTSPTLESFSFNLNEGLLTLYFSETISGSSLNGSGFTIQNASTSTGNSLSLGMFTVSVQNGSTPVLTLLLTSSELNELKRMAMLATSINDTWISAESFSVIDTSGNRLQEIAANDALQASDFIEDTTSPILFAFDIDFDAGLITIEFDETVRASSLNFAKITIQDASSQQYTLTGGVATINDSHLITINFSMFDLNQIKKIRGLGSTVQITASGSANISGTGMETNRNTYLSIASGAVEDVSFNPIIEIPPDNAIRVRNTIPDTTSPKLVSFSFNLDDEQLILTFTETVDVLTLMLDQFTITGSLSGGENYTLTGGSTPSEDDYIIVIQLDITDVNSIKRNLNTAVDDSTTFLCLSPSTVLDMNANPLELIPPLQVSNFSEDRRPPVLESFDLDLDSPSLLILTFNETVRVQTLSAAVTIQDSFSADYSDPSTFRRLESGNPLTSDDPIQKVELQLMDVNYIKAFTSLATSENNTFICFSGLFIQDMNGNEVVPISPADTLQVTNFTPDSTFPLLLSFDLNLSSEQILFIFDETINPDSFDAARIQLGSDPLNTELNSYVFVGGEVTTGIGTNVSLNISMTDLNNIKINEELATSERNTFLHLNAGLVADMNENYIQTMNGINVSKFTPDQVSPELNSFSLDMDEGSLSLTFTEPVRVSSLTASSFSLQNAHVMPTVSYTLTDAFSNSSNSPEIELTIQPTDLNRIKQIPGLASSVNDTFLIVDSDGVEDMSGNSVTAIVIANALQATEFVSDSTNPRLTEFDIDIDSGELTMMFDETVRASSLKPNEITLQGSQFGTAMNVYSLSGGIPTIEDSTVVVLSLSFLDLNQIKKIRNLASILLDPDMGSADASGSGSGDNSTTPFPLEGNTYLSITADTIMDVNGNPIEEIPPNNALRVSRIILDTTPPALVSFDFNLDTEQMILRFTETVDTRTLMVNQFTILGNPQSESYSLSGGYTPSEDDYIITIQLDIFDLNSLKSKLNIAVDNASTFLCLTPHAIRDMNANLLNSVATNPLAVQHFFGDTRSPVLQLFDFDLNSGLLILTFNETMRLQTLNTTQITIQDGSTLNTGDTTTFRTLIFSPPLTSDDNTVVTVPLQEEDANYIKTFTNLATSAANTFLSLTPQAIEDTSGNEITPIPPDSARPVTLFTPDSVSPSLISYELDLTNDTLVFTFNETVNVDSFEPTRISLFGNPSNTNSYNLTGGMLSLQNSTLVTVTLVQNDVRAIKINDNIGTSLSSTFLMIDEALVVDMNANSIVPSEFAVQATRFVKDQISPRLEDFHLDMNIGLLHVSFCEPVRVATFQPSSFTFQSSSNTSESSVSYTLNSTVPHSPNDVNVTFSIESSDLNNIKQIPNLATALENTFLVVDNSGIQDMSGNNVVGIPTSTALQASSFTPDTTRPQLDQFDIDLDTGRLTLEFNEIVFVNSLDVSQVTLQNSNFIDSATSYRLTGGLALNNFNQDLALEIELLPQDLNLIKVLTMLATNPNNTFISLTNLTVKDANNNQIVPVTSDGAIPVTDFIPDSTSPELLSFDLDLTAEQIRFTFDETVNINSLNPRVIKLSADSSEGICAYTLTGGDVLNDENSTLVILQFSMSDLNAIKVNEDLATSVNNSFLSFDGALVTDMSENYNEPVLGVQADSFIEDQLQPQLSSFTLNVNLGLLCLVFSEPVRISTLNPARFTIVNPGTVNYTLSGGFSNNTNGPIVNLTIVQSDLNAIKLITNLATNSDNTNLFMAEGAVADMNNNEVLPISENSPLTVNTFVSDTTPPQLMWFDADLLDCSECPGSGCTGMLILQFSEVVRLTEDVLMTLSLQNRKGDASAILDLVESPTVSSNGDGLVQIGLSSIQTNTILCDTSIGATVESLFITISEGEIFDFNDNTVMPILTSSATRVRFICKLLNHTF